LTTALLLMDLQSSLVDKVDDPDYVERINSAASACRSAGYPVIWVKVGFRDGYPEVSPDNQVFSRVAGTGVFLSGDTGAELHRELDVQPLDAVVTKKRISAFAGSDLDLLLRSRKIDHLVLAGLTTAGVVLSTLREAADRDYRLTVLSDGCFNHDPEVQRVLMDKVFPMQATVTTVAAWLDVAHVAV
jgi:nicotinamidase-related amidase